MAERIVPRYTSYVPYIIGSQPVVKLPKLGNGAFLFG